MSGKSLNLGKASGQKIARILLRQSAELEAMLAGLRPQVSSAEYDAACTMVGRIMGEIYVAAFYPIFEAYPDLKPPGFP